MKACRDLVSAEKNRKPARKGSFSFRLILKLALIIVGIALALALLQGPDTLAEKYEQRQKEKHAYQEQLKQFLENK